MRCVGSKEEQVVVGSEAASLDPADDLDQFGAVGIGDFRPGRAGGFEGEILQVAPLVLGEVGEPVVAAASGVECGDGLVGLRPLT